MFEGELEQDRLERLRRRLAKIVEEEDDSVRFHFLCARRKSSIESLGRGEVPGEEPEMYVV